MDDMGNSDTTFFAPVEPEDQKIERRDEQAKVKAGMRILEEVLERLTARITFYDTLDSLHCDVESNAEVHLREVITNQKTKANLELEKEYWQGLYDNYA